MKLPAFQFYPGDWRKDVGVQSLDFEARGIWFEILCLMHESERRGVLILNGISMPIEALSRLLGITMDLLKQNLTKIEAHGVSSREPITGALFCRRMVRDENLRKVRTEAGKLGGNPALVNQKQTSRVKQKPTPSPSSSASSSEMGPTDVGSTVDEWLTGLSKDPGYHGIDVRREFAKMKTWCLHHQKQATRRRFVNWLNRCESPVQTNLPNMAVPRVVVPARPMEGEVGFPA